ncbi:carcinoembryonic antigen-related cell adhesion molecule 5-like [Polyodon spathula]|uniref:carcinoembryonic antigen-related cell adhesion molecule 5-like n=1 Tax=Polyodon spathula TaxID=7913 RepID=UPI001B7E2056|nr:carcinoembryonic antigen-related cell adhesion molecule 5-like [Polyodon spathula]
MATKEEVTPVYGVLNSSVSLSLETTSLLHSSDIVWKKGDSLMVKVQNFIPSFYEDYGTRVKIFPDGTLSLAKTLKTDEESKEVTPVYVVLGSSVFLHAGNENTQSTSDIRWKKGDILVVRVKNDVTNFYEDYRYRSEIFTNGTLRLDSTSERDSGLYIVERFNKHGRLLCTEAHHLITIKNTDFQKVYGALGKSVFLHVSTKNLLNGIDILWKKRTVPIARIKESTAFYYGDYENKANVFPNGTLRLDRIDDADTGPYSGVVSDANGRNIHSEIAHLFMMSYTECTPVYEAKGSTTFLFLENHNDIQTISFEKTWKKGGSLVAEFKGSIPYYYGHYGTRTGVFKNGTLRLDRTQEWDTGNYSVDFFDKDKNNIGRWAIQLFIIAAPGIETDSIYSAAVIYGIFRHFVTSILVLIFIVGALRCMIKKLHLHIGKEKEVPIQPKQDTETEVLSTTEI